RKVDDAVGDHDIERSVVERQLLDPSLKKSHGTASSQPLGLGELLRRYIHACDGAARTYLCHRGERVHARAAAKIEHAVARQKARERKVVADARERAHCLGGKPVEQSGGIAERFSDSAAGWEVKGVDVPVRHVSVHVCGLPVQVLRGTARDGGICGCSCHYAGKGRTKAPARTLGGHALLSLTALTERCPGAALQWRLRRASPRRALRECAIRAHSRSSPR